ncbi:monovalent cation/H+ antiporter complex subunit F [Ornithinimicrobium faecis]|uniref:monovalent cation/H+ antiporter complex subunit F n=1 Tax=Ornithinimicrobium faecis TaxID=2934158 RepID=UPI00211942AD|nr:monovalent cation/H+ antiporter complex subunit F [Ornithinimicrobium sp. HY1745]
MGFSDIMTWAIGILLVCAALLTVVRIITGPSVLDRVVASDVLVSIVVCTLGAQTALVEGPSTMGLLITLSLVGFMGSVAVARFVARDRDYPVEFDEPDSLEDSEEAPEPGVLEVPDAHQGPDAVPDEAEGPDAMGRPDAGEGSGAARGSDGSDSVGDSATGQEGRS